MLLLITLSSWNFLTQIVCKREEESSLRPPTPKSRIMSPYQILVFSEIPYDFEINIWKIQFQFSPSLNLRVAVDMPGLMQYSPFFDGAHVVTFLVSYVVRTHLRCVHVRHLLFDGRNQWVLSLTFKRCGESSDFSIKSILFFR